MPKARLSNCCKPLLTPPQNSPFAAACFTSSAINVNYRNAALRRLVFFKQKLPSIKTSITVNFSQIRSNSFQFALKKN